MEQERDELLKRQRDAILDVQQRSGMKQMLLERKMAALSETLEKKQAQLCAALSASNVDPAVGSSAANKLEVEPHVAEGLKTADPRLKRLFFLLAGDPGG